MNCSSSLFDCHVVLKSQSCRLAALYKHGVSDASLTAIMTHSGPRNAYAGSSCRFYAQQGICQATLQLHFVAHAPHNHGTMHPCKGMSLWVGLQFWFCYNAVLKRSLTYVWELQQTPSQQGSRECCWKVQLQTVCSNRHTFQINNLLEVF